ncbi:Thiamine biosynthesis protein [Pyrolobus fumarii 1A]|uniref:Thiamine biosynthesis protein n=1 Tax=Pyrolobus fumarii (strain DSM 11204 / 1A) TaxID=694429 RepID=G0EDU6_PYRF1|nr:thiamine biosynthesis protein [Pyrolobus fumarii]AEM38715.1 Thiamine biosynthesis protein [Pyrolobus fumarii 1A]
MSRSEYPGGVLTHGKLLYPLPPGRYLLLYSGGLDSTYLLKTLLEDDNIEVVPLHAYISRVTLHAAIENLKRVKPRGKQVKLCITNHGDLLRLAVRRLRKSRLVEYTCIACKALMMMEASIVAEKLGGVNGIITGESLGQVASQTLPNMVVVHSYSKLPIYTPLLAADKHEASNIMAHLLEKTPSCRFLPPRRVTRADYVLTRMILDEIGIEELASLTLVEIVTL